MPPFLLAIPIGLVGGLVAAAVMEAFQTLAAPLFGQDGGGGEGATTTAADAASTAATGKTVAKNRRTQAGRLVHYATGAALGLGYALLAATWPPAALGFGVVFGIAVALLLDDLVVPGFGFGPWPWQTPLATHAYGLSAHVVFGAALEGARRLGALLVG